MQDLVGEGGDQGWLGMSDVGMVWLPGGPWWTCGMVAWVKGCLEMPQVGGGMLGVPQLPNMMLIPQGIPWDISTC